MFGEEHPSEDNYFCLFSGNNQSVGFFDQVPRGKTHGEQSRRALLKKGLSFKGYSQSLPAIGSEVDVTPPGCRYPAFMAASMFHGSASPVFRTGRRSPARLTCVSRTFPPITIYYRQSPSSSRTRIIMHNGVAKDCVPVGDSWLQQNLDAYYQRAKAPSHRYSRRE